MAVFLTSLVLFLGALGLHLIVWKIRLPKFHTRTLLLLFAFVLFLWLVTLTLRPMSLAEVAHVGLFYTSLSLCHVITYSAFEAASPTLRLIRNADDAAGRAKSSGAAHLDLAAAPSVNAP